MKTNNRKNASRKRKAVAQSAESKPVNREQNLRMLLIFHQIQQQEYISLHELSLNTGFAARTLRRDIHIWWKSWTIRLPTIDPNAATISRNSSPISPDHRSAPGKFLYSPPWKVSCRSLPARSS